MPTDGTIVIDTHIDTAGVSEGTSELKQAFKRLTSSLSEAKKTGQSATKQTVKSFAELNQQAKKFESQGIPTQKYREIQAQIEAAQERLEGLKKVQDNFLAAGGSDDNTYFKGVQKDIAKVTAELERAQGVLQQLITDGQAFTFGGQVGTAPSIQAEAGTQETSHRLIGAFQNLNAAVNAYRQSLAGAVGYTGIFESTLGGLATVIHSPIAGLQSLSAVLKSIPSAAAKAAIAGVRKGLANLSAILKKVVKEAQKAALSLLQLAGKGILGGLKKISSGIFGLTKGTKKARGGLKGMLASSLLLGTAFMAFYAVINSVKEGMNSLAQYSGETNATLSSLKSSLTQLRNSFATAFAPILTAVAPALNSLIGLLNSAATAMARLMAMLTGKNSFVKAAKVQQDYAAGLKDTSGAAKEAGKETEKMLAPFDDLIQIEKKQESSGGAGGAGGGELSPEEMFETVQVEPLNFDSWGEAFDSFLTYLLDTGIPALENTLSGLATWINDFSSNLYEMFRFPGVREKVQQLGKEVGEAFNDFTEDINWKQVGKSLGAGFDLAIQFLVNFIETYDWDKLGASLAEAVNGAVLEVDWYSFGELLWANFKIGLETLAGFITNLDMPELAQSASRIVMGFLDSITETLNNVSWRKIGNQIATFFANIDYSGIATSLFTGLGAALASLAEFLWGLIEQAWDSVVGWWRENAYEDGKFTIEGLLQGIADIMANIGTWIVEHIFNPFINGFKEAFGIHSPSTVMMELAGDLMNGLLLGIQNFIPSLISKFSQIKTQILQKWDEVKKATKEKWNSIKSSLSTTWSTIKTAAGTKFEEVRQTVLTAWENVKENASQKWSEIQTNLGAAWDSLKNTAGRTFTDLKDGIVEAWENLKKKTSDLWGDNGISGIIKGIINGIVLEIEGMVNHIIDCLNWIINQVNKLSIEVPDTPLTDGFTIGFDLSTLDHISLPRLASGTVIPPRAGEFAAILGDNNREAEVVSPVSAIKQALLEAMQEAGGTGSQTITLRFDGSMSALARVLKPELDREAARRGTKLVTVGGR